MKVPFSILAVLLFLWYSALSAEGAIDSEQPRVILESVGASGMSMSAAKIARLSEEQRQLLIGYYRSVASSKDDRAQASFADHVLVRLGDPDALREAVASVLNSPVESQEFGRILDRLIVAGRPETVEMLAKGMFVDEPYVIKPMQGDILPPPPKPYVIAGGVLLIVANSHGFKDEVKKWADENSKANPRNVLPVVRRWWELNKDSIVSRDWKMVNPGEDLRTAELRQRDEIKERSAEYRRALIASGKDPSDTDNWNEWREVIYPSLLKDGGGARAPAELIKVDDVRKPDQAAAGKEKESGPSSESVRPWILALSTIVLLSAIAFLVTRQR